MRLVQQQQLQSEACHSVLLSRRICAFTYSLDFLSNEKFPANKPKQPTLVDYALSSPCRVPPGSETGQQDTDSGRTVTTVIRQPLTKVFGEESLSVSRFQSLLLFAFKILVSQAISLFSFIFHFLSPFRFYILQSIVGRRWGQRTTLRGEFFSSTVESGDWTQAHVTSTFSRSTLYLKLLWGIFFHIKSKDPILKARCEPSSLI